jgi:hypothetical protein
VLFNVECHWDYAIGGYFAPDSNERPGRIAFVNGHEIIYEGFADGRSSRAPVMDRLDNRQRRE